MLVTIPVWSRKDCGVFRLGEAEIRSEAKRRVRKSRAEHDASTSRSNNGARFRFLRTIDIAAESRDGVPAGQPMAAVPTWAVPT